MKLGSKMQLSPASSTGTGSSGERVLQPMCLVKQLEIPVQEASGLASISIAPRTSLTKELGKYMKPAGLKDGSGQQVQAVFPILASGVNLLTAAVSRPVFAKILPKVEAHTSVGQSLSGTNQHPAFIRYVPWIQVAN